MSKPADILTQIQTQLKNSSQLSYISDSNVFLGVREGISIFPAIVIEPLEDIESDLTYGRQDIILRVVVTAFVQVYDKDKQLASSDTAKARGIMDLENDIKIAISADRTLSGKVTHTRIARSVYEFVEYPIRSVAMELEILYRQSTTARS